MGVKIKRIKHMIGRREQHESITIYIYIFHSSISSISEIP